MTDLSAWPALVLTAGLATRLRPLSDIRAKGALPVAGQPLVGRILRWLRAAGVRQVVLNLHHRPETITRVVGDGAEWDLAVRYSWEAEVLGSAGGPKRAIPLLNAERFLIVNGDTLTDGDLGALAAQHMETHALVTMAVVPGDTNRYGGVLVDDRDVVRGFAGRQVADLKVRATEDPPIPVARSFSSATLHFIGVQAVNASAFAEVPGDRPYETVRQLYPSLIASHPDSVRAYRSEAEFLDVGTPEDYLRSVDVIAGREHVALDRGTSCRIDPTATVRHSILWDRVEVQAGAHLTDCVVGDDVVVPAGARHERAAIVTGPGGLVVRGF
jgi:NDP-sugar pyrophosphorylase family protein